MNTPVICKNEKQLKSALSKGENYIRIENSELVVKINLIKFLKPATWTAIGGGLVVVIVAAIGAAHPPEPTDVVFPYVKAAIRFGSGTVAAVAATSVVSSVGFTAATTLITLGVAFGGIDLLNSLYHNYEIIESKSKYLILKKVK